MSKNLTRKSLALGALIGLASTVIAGAPALAADELTVAPSAGTVFAVPVNKAFTLNAALPSGSSGSISQLKYKVVNEGAVAVNAVSSVKLANQSTQTSSTTGAYTLPDTTPVPAGTSTGVKQAAAASAGAAATVYVAGTADVQDVDEDTTTTPDSYVYTHAYTEPTATSLNSLSLSLASSSSTTATQTVKVTAFLDSVANGTLDAGEWSTTKTITFVKYSELTTDAKIDAALQGASTITGSLKFTNVNNEMLTNTDVKALFTKGDDTNYDTSGAAAGTDVAAAWDATNGFVFSLDISGLTTSSLAKDTVVKLQPIYVTTNTGTAVTTAVQTVTVASVVPAFTKSDTAQSVDTIAGGLAELVALNETKTIKWLLKDGSTPAVAVKGAVVKVSVDLDGETLSSTAGSVKTLAINGTTYSSNSTVPGNGTTAALSLTSDASGYVTVTYTTVGYSDGDNVIFNAISEGVNAAAAKGIETERAPFSAYVENYGTGDWENSKGDWYGATTTDGAAVKPVIVVLDQFNKTVKDGKYLVTATQGTAGQTDGTAGGSNTFATVVSGKATLTLLDNGTGVTGANSDVYTLALKSVDSLGVQTAVNGVWNSAGTAGSSNTAQFAVKISSAADATPGQIVLGQWGDSVKGTDGVYTIQAGDNGSKTNPNDLSYSEFKSVDLRSGYETAPTPKNFDESDSGAIYVDGKVSSAASATHAAAIIPGATVTISGANMSFVSWSPAGEIWGNGSITLQANSTGFFDLYAYSHVAGSQTITIKSGGITTTLTVYVDQAPEVAASKITAVVGDGSAQFQAGRALDVAFKVTDKFGNPVALTNSLTAGVLDTDSAKLVVTQSGSGYLGVDPGHTTDATGAAASKLITNFGDLGTSTITAKVVFGDTDTAALSGVVSSEFGLTDVTDVSAAGKAIYVNTEFAKGKVVTVYIDGKRMPVKAAEATDNAVERKYTQKKAGVHTVTVRISGGVVATEKVTTTK